jgi:O-antigen/teichoic acid export membrane protein
MQMSSPPASPEETADGVPPPRLLFRNILQGSGLYSLAIVGSTIASLVLLPVNTRFLDKADIGVLELLEKVSVAVSLLLGLNFSSALGYFYFSRNSPAERAPVVGTMFAGSLLIGMVAGLLGWIFAAPLSQWVFTSPDYASYLRVIFTVLPLSFLAEVGMSWLRVENRAFPYLGASFFRIGVLLAMTVISVALLRLRVWGVLAGNLSSLGLLAIVLTVYCFRIYRFTFDAQLFRQMVRFAFPLGLSGIAMFIIHFGDRFILTHYRPLGDLGVYSIAYKIGMLISVVHASFQNYWNAQIFQIAKRADADSVIARTFSYMSLALSLCGLGLIVASKPVLHFLIPTNPALWDAAFLVPVIVLAYFIRAIGEFFRCIFLVEGRSDYEAACTWIGAAVCLIGYFTLIPRWGMWGAAYATLITFLVLLVVSLVWVYRVRRFSIESVRLFKIMLATAIPLAAYFLVPVSSRFAQIGWASLLLLSYPLLLGLLRFPTPAEWNLLGSVIGRARRILA